MGVEAEESDIMTSAYATALYLSEELGSDFCYVIGEEGLKDELRGLGIDVLPRVRSEEADTVVVGMDRGLNYEKIWGGLSALLSGADFIATNPDPTLPTERGPAPGAGASIGALSGASEMEPLKIVGKPSSYIIEVTLERHGLKQDESLVLGDRVSTDIAAGNSAGITTVLVLSGVISEGDLGSLEGQEKPDYIVESLSEMLN
jgi:HAD superfamily hydrolase (TIGR01450 family)